MTIRKSGGYRRLASFQTVTIIYDATYHFSERFVDSRSRTVDQIVQAARTGRQNIAEGNRASATSSQTELRLTHLTHLTDLSDAQRWTLYSRWLKNNDATVRSNSTICLIHQCNYLLDQQIVALEQQFVTEGGYSERLAAERLAHRQRDRSDRSEKRSVGFI